MFLVITVIRKEHLPSFSDGRKKGDENGLCIHLDDFE